MSTIIILQLNYSLEHQQLVENMFFEIPSWLNPLNCDLDFTIGNLVGVVFREGV
jgi:hypothetical protein